MTPQLSIARESASLWRVTFNNPPINMFIPTTIDELGALMTDVEAGPVCEGRRIPVGESRFFRRPS